MTPSTSATTASPGPSTLALLAPGLLAVVTFVALAAADAGFRPTAWYPAGLFLLALLVLVTIIHPSRLHPAAVVASLALAAFTAWSFASVAWSDVRGEAWDGSNRTLVYLVGFALFVLMPRPRGAPVVLLGLYSMGIALLALGTLVRVASADEPREFFIGGRLAEPAGYTNATAALCLGALWPLIALATRRELSSVLRGACLGAGVLLLGTATLAQSRASVIATAIVALVYLAVVPGRVRGLVALGLTFGASIAVAPVLLDVYPAVRTGDVGDAGDRALVAVAAAALAVTVVGWAVAALDARIDVSEVVARRIRLATGAAAALTALAVIGAAAASVDHPADRLSTAWREFKHGQAPQDPSSNFGSGLGSNRYDFWRVALDRFSDVPLTGMGADNFATSYLEERRSDEEPLYPHSLPIRILSGLGLPGALLFAVFAVSALVAAVRGRICVGVAGSALLGGLVASTYWAVHGAVDWFFSFPGMTLPALAWLGLAANSAIPASRRGRGLTALAVALLAPVAAALFFAGWVAARDVESASTTWASDRAAAFTRLDRARRLDPFSDRPDLVEGVIASRTDDLPRMQKAFRHALERNPRGWFARLELALVAAESGRRREALAYVSEARRLNPRDDVLREVHDTLTSGAPLVRGEIEAAIRERVESREK